MDQIADQSTTVRLSAYFYRCNIGRIWRVAEVLEYGVVGINEGHISTEIAPFSGTKENGIGPIGSSLGLEIRRRPVTLAGGRIVQALVPAQPPL